MIWAHSNAQKKTAPGEIPDTVMNSLKSKFPRIDDVKWEKRTDSNYCAKFKQQGIKHVAMFDTTGAWSRTEYEIKHSELPKAVKNTIDGQFDGYKINEAWKFDDAKLGPGYIADVEKGKEVYRVQFSPDGRVISKENRIESMKKKL
jgi:hypothetical protein